MDGARRILPRCPQPLVLWWHCLLPLCALVAAAAAAVDDNGRVGSMDAMPRIRGVGGRQPAPSSPSKPSMGQISFQSSAPQQELLSNLPFPELRGFTSSRTTSTWRRSAVRPAPSVGCVRVPLQQELLRDGGSELCAHVPQDSPPREARSAGTLACARLEMSAVG